MVERLNYLSIGVDIYNTYFTVLPKERSRTSGEQETKQNQKEDSGLNQNYFQVIEPVFISNKLIHVAEKRHK